MSARRSPPGASSRRHRCNAFVVVIALTILTGRPIPAQGQGTRNATVPEMVLGNALAGGLTAGISAALRGGNVKVAFVRGGLGGLVHGGGKALASSRYDAVKWPGTLLSGVGTSMVVNSGHGLRLLDTISIPVFSARLRISPGSPRGFSVALNAFETLVALRTWTREGITFDLGRSLPSGAFVFEGGFLMNPAGETVQGETLGSTAIVSRVADDVARTTRHEIAHVHQFWFVQETWGRPLEQRMLSATRLDRAVPKWLELGITGPVILLVANEIVFRDNLRKLWEAEAGALER